MKMLLLLAALGLASLPVMAQNTVPSDAPAPVLAGALAFAVPEVPNAATDTAAALHRLFAHGRAHRSRLVVGTLGVGGGLTALGLFSKPTTNDPLDLGLRRLFGIAAGVTTTAILGAGLIGFDQYSRENEAQALTAFQNHALPKRVRRQLTPACFDPGNPGPGRRN